MSIWLADLEGDGLLEEVTKIHCGVFLSLDGKDKRTFSPLEGKDYIQKMLAFMDTCPCIVFHNGYGYDHPVLKKLYGYEFKGKKIDTLVLSRLLNPKRPVPPHCPVKGKPHSIETWGYRVGRGKPEHNDWEEFSKEMLHRCSEDVEILRLVYLSLVEEQRGYNWKLASQMTHKLFEYLQLQEQYGWLVDREWINRSIHMLEHWMDRINKVLADHLPVTMIIEEVRDKDSGLFKYVRAPFVRSGDYHQNTINWMEKVGWDPADRIVGGPYSRVMFRRISLDKPDELKDYLLSVGWEPAEWNLDKDGNRSSPKLDKNDPFEGVEGGVGRLAAKYIQCKSRRAILEGYLRLIRPDGRIASVVANLAETGRATHRNIVNVPNSEAFFGKWMRKCFTCKPGYVLVGTDSAGCQNRMLAARVGDPKFTDTLINGRKEDGTSIHHVNQKAIKDIAGLEVSYGRAKNLNYAS